MILDRHPKRGRQAVRVLRRAPARHPRPQPELWPSARTAQGQRVVFVPADPSARIAVRGQEPGHPQRPDPATARLLLAHAHRARHFLADRAVIARVGPARRQELLEELERMRTVMRTLGQQIEVTTRSIEAMDRLVGHLQRLTGILHDSGVHPANADADPVRVDERTEANQIRADGGADVAGSIADPPDAAEGQEG
ncbi:hypothetical protein BBJ28_00016490 [Nothophytophthora sp. Chile5]|nr:hypothetical protein BBJ28_00016490 [Nothophytophthora sp. Chile5]